MSTTDAILRRYLFRLYPDRAQTDVLHEQRQMMVDLWNALLQRHEDIWRRTRGQRGVVHSLDRATYSFFDMTGEITQLRSACQEWAALSVWSAHRVAKALDDAFKAFFRRVKEGAGAQSGYPRYRRRVDGSRIPHLHNLPPGQKSGSGSGCRLTNCRARPEKSESGANAAIPGSAGKPRVALDEVHKHMTGSSVNERCETPPSGVLSNRTWSLALKGITGSIHARGMLPAEAASYKNADVLWRDGKWWLSITGEFQNRQRSHGARRIKIELDCLDGLARINGRLETPDKLLLAASLDERADEVKSERDRHWPKRAPDDPDWQDVQAEISRLQARAARVRHECLHVWTARIVRDASDITIIAPQVSENVRTPRGDAKQWGAEIAVVSTLNRKVLSCAPAAAIAMLQYKAAEAGIRCDVIADVAPVIAVGGDLVTAGKELRAARRQLRKAA